MIGDNRVLRRRRAILGRREPWPRDQLVEELRQVVGTSLVAFAAARLLERHGAVRLARVWTIIAEEIVGESIPDALAHEVVAGCDRSVAFEEAVAAVRVNEGIMLARGMEIASGTIAGGVRCLLPLAEIDEFWRRVGSATPSAHRVSALPVAPRRIG